MSNILQLLILGNGFDLHCGLKSSYKDFFRQKILDEYTEQCGHPRMRSDCTGFWETILFTYYLENRNADYNWCDVEVIIKDTLITIKNEIWKRSFEYVSLRRDPNQTSLFYDNSLKKFIFTYCYKFLYGLSSQGRDFLKLNHLFLLMQNLLEELHNFERRFCLYLRGNIVDPKGEMELNNEYIVNAFNLLSKLTGFSTRTFKKITTIIQQETRIVEEEISPGKKTIEWRDINILSNEFTRLKNTHILSFNYTALFDVLDVESPCEYSNVHGKLCTNQCNGNCVSSNIIFGIDDALIQSQSNYAEFRIFSKTYRKMFNTNSPTSILPACDNNSLEIKFYGHSLSEADYSYFQSIFDYYNLYSNNKVSLVFYYSLDFEQTDAIYNLISSYGTSLSNKEQGKNLIHKLLLENRLKIVKID